MSVEKITLRKPLYINGEARKELTYDIDEISSYDLTKAQGLKSKIGGKEIAGTITLAQADYPYQICLGIYAVIAVNPDISEDDLLRLKGYDLTKLANIGQRFFIEPEEQVQVMSSEPQEDMQNTTIAH